MYYELIYTRCRQGIDILRGGKAISSDGFKVYSCTPNLMKDGTVDLPFLLDAAQAKQTYSDPVFMDDAYLYFVPDKGSGFMVDFHPVHYDPAAKGDYSHRPGNFLNQILVGDYSGFYPFELFGDTSVWNAKARGEAYYYETPASPLPSRNIADPPGQLGVDEIAAFIADGREEALKAAVSFLISQFEQAPENRKFLVIRDESSENIEKWTAAIELAFSPRIASVIPFATRMDGFATSGNRYTVNQLGVYQTQINLQDPNQKQRYRAMIVGVDERDRTNAAAARPLASSPFALLDGKGKKALFEADTSHPYYDHITRFDDTHLDFCREFLKMFDIKEPGSGIFRLFESYAALVLADPLPDAKTVEQNILVLGGYRLSNCSCLKCIYQRINKEVELRRFLKEDPQSALQIIKWLQSVSKLIGDNSASKQLTDLVCKEFADQIIKEKDVDRCFKFWENIKSSEFASVVAKYIVSPQIFKQFTDSGRVTNTFVIIYLECAASLGNVGEQDIKKITSAGMKLCFDKNNSKSAGKVINALSQNKNISYKEILLSIAKEAEAEFAIFIINCLIESDESLAASHSDLVEFFKLSVKKEVGHLFIYVLNYLLPTLKSPADIEGFIKLLKEIRSIGNCDLPGNDDLVTLFEVLDAKLNISEKGCGSAARILQQEKPQAAKCPNSAHIYALELVGDKGTGPRSTSISGEFRKLSGQGFPSEKNPDYVQNLTKKLLKAGMNPKELDNVIRLFAPVHLYFVELVRCILEMTKPKQNDEWNILMNVAADTQNSATCGAIIQECAKLRHPEKALEQLANMLKQPGSQKYFQGIAGEVKEKTKDLKPKSVLDSFKGVLNSFRK